MAEPTTGPAIANAEMAAAWDGPEGDHWADNADRYEAAAAEYSRALLAAVPVDDDSSVLDIGCGSGATTIAIGRLAPAGTVLGVDLSARMLAIGRTAAQRAGLPHVRFEQADAQVHPFQPAGFDLAISNFGAMFFADPVAAFSNVRNALRPAGAIAFMAWRELDRNEWVSSIRAALAAGRDLPNPAPGVQGPFSLADHTITTDRLRAAGYSDINLTSIDEPVCMGSDIDDAYAFVSTFGITRGLTAGLDDHDRTAALEQLRRSLGEHATDDGVRYPGSAWLITARNGGRS